MKAWVAIPLRQRRSQYMQYALVDKADLPLVQGYKWTNCGQYARATYVEQGEIKTIAMHRLLLGAKRGEIVDHINGNGLDNRRANIRICTYSQNGANLRRGVYVTRTGYRGVSQDKKGRWVASATHGKEKRRAFAPTAKAAARLYDDFARELHGDFARLNFPRRGERGTNVGDLYVRPGKAA